MMTTKLDPELQADLDEMMGESARAALNGKFKPASHQEQEARAEDGDDVSDRAKAPWPEPLDGTAFHGPAGKFARLIGPHTEADEAALLTQFLIVLGNIIGRGVYREAEGARHYPNLFGVLVGATGRGRKGSGFARVRSGVEAVAPDWVAKNIAGGLSSGEGLIWAVRNPVEATTPLKEKGRFTGEFQTAITDAGIDDKRLLIVETEFARVLKVAEREASTLSAVIRQAWDSGNLQTITKNSPARATGAHISIIGHITDEELARNLNTTEAANGFANRILWICSRRSKLLPRGSRVDEDALKSFFGTLRSAIAWASVPRELDFSEAWQAWDAVYPLLTAGRPGLLGAVLGRAEAQTLRLAVLYAALDCSPTIKLEHLLAALAVWEYVQASIEYVFGDRLGDPDADAILDALRGASEGLTRTQISELFSGHLSAGRLQRALGVLLKGEMAAVTRIETAGRPAELWRFVSAKKAV
jgi:hypothetical protein